MLVTSKQIRHKILVEELENLGATVLSIQDIMFLVEYNFKNEEDRNFKLQYIYREISNNEFSLERKMPYYTPERIYKSETDVIKTIEIDIEQFTNAINSRNYEKFIELNNKFNNIINLFEDYFLYYNVDEDDFKMIEDTVDDLAVRFKNFKDSRKRVFKKKNPDIL